MYICIHTYIHILKTTSARMAFSITEDAASYHILSPLAKTISAQQTYFCHSFLFFFFNVWDLFAILLEYPPYSQ